MTPKEVLDLAQKNRVEIVDLRFCDLPGLWQHFSLVEYIGIRTQALLFRTE